MVKPATDFRKRLLPVLLVFLLFNGAGLANAAGLNTDVALTPPEGGTIVRAQWRYSELSDDPLPMDRKVRLNVFPVTVVHGVTHNFSVLGTVPVVHREVRVGATGDRVRDTGVGDIPLLAKYRFYQDDRPGQTTRWAAIAGAEVPSFDSAFSSDSLNPIFGTVWTHQRVNWWLDWNLIHQFNTGGGVDRHDVLRGDAALSRRFLSGRHEAAGPWGLFAIGEVNSTYWTDGSTRVFVSPGLQLITPRWIVKGGVQLPVHQDMKSPRLETDFTTVVSVRFQF